MTPEGRVKAKVKRALEALPRRYRFMPVQNGMGAPGLDFYNCIDGRFIAIETKVPGARLTPRQKQTAGDIADAGGLVFVIRDEADIANFVLALRSIPPGVGHVHDLLTANGE